MNTLTRLRCRTVQLQEVFGARTESAQMLRWESLMDIEVELMRTGIQLDPLRIPMHDPSSFRLASLPLISTFFFNRMTLSDL